MFQHHSSVPLRFMPEGYEVGLIDIELVTKENSPSRLNHITTGQHEKPKSPKKKGFLAFQLSGVSRVPLSSYSASLRSFAPVSPFIQTKMGFSPHLLSEELTALLS